MDEQTKLECLIGGRKYILEGVESEEYIQQLARYLDRKIGEAKRSRPMPGIIDTNSLYIIINIVDDLFKQRRIAEHALEKAYKLTEELDFYKNELARAGDESKAKLAEMAEENLSLKKKLQSAPAGPYTPQSDNLSPKPAVFKVRTETKTD